MEKIPAKKEAAAYSCCLATSELISQRARQEFLKDVTPGKEEKRQSTGSCCLSESRRTSLGVTLSHPKTKTAFYRANTRASVLLETAQGNASDFGTCVTRGEKGR